jgi:hypothetical protein
MKTPLLLRLVVVSMPVLAVAACGGSGTGPSATTSSVTVSDQGSGTIFIGNSRQFLATERLSDGMMRSAPNATWRSDAPTVATVSASGQVTAIAAGEATITAEVNPVGSLRIRVFPSFGGSWRGTDLAVSCVDSGAFAGFCADPSNFVAGEAFVHQSGFTQQDAVVNGVLDLGGGVTAAATGQVSIGGELALSSATTMPPDPAFTSVVQNWRVRSDTSTAPPSGRRSGSMVTSNQVMPLDPWAAYSSR